MRCQQIIKNTKDQCEADIVPGTGRCANHLYDRLLLSYDLETKKFFALIANVVTEPLRVEKNEDTT